MMGLCLHCTSDEKTNKEEGHKGLEEFGGTASEWLKKTNKDGVNSVGGFDCHQLVGNRDFEVRSFAVF